MLSLFTEKKFFENSLAFLFGSAVYPLLEILWRGYTHISMSLLGGICMLSLHLIRKKFSECSLFVRALLGTVLISAWELFFGVVLNLVLGLDVWDYSSQRLNFMGQICLSYMLLWLLLCFPAFFVSRIISSFASMASLSLKKNNPS